MVRLDNLHPPRGSHKKPQRVGRGIGARKSKTAGRGNKGQLSRSGASVRPGFEGGQMPLHRRLPKRGFTNIFRTEYTVVNVEALSRFSAGERVTPESLKARGLVRRRLPVKILGEGELKTKLTVVVHAFSAGARQKIEKAGGSVEVITRAPAARESTAGEAASA